MSIRSPDKDDERFRTSAGVFPDTFPVAFTHQEFPDKGTCVHFIIIIIRRRIYMQFGQKWLCII